MFMPDPLSATCAVIAVFLSGHSVPTPSEHKDDILLPDRPNNSDCLTTFGPLNVELDNLSSKINSTYFNLTGIIEDSEKSMTAKLNSHFETSNTELEAIRLNVAHQLEITKSEPAFVTSTLRPLKEDVGILKEILNGKILSRNEINKLEEDVGLLKIDISAMKDDSGTIKDKLEKLERLFASVNQRSSKLEAEEKQIKSSQEEMGVNLEGIRDLLTSMAAKLGTKATHGPGAGALDASYMALCFSLLANVVLVTMMMLKFMSKSEERQSQPQNLQDNRDGVRDVVDVVKLSVVTFSETTKGEAETFFESINRPCPTIYVINDPSEIGRVPLSTLYLVVIPYDGRNSIVEDMDDTHGTKRRNTVEKLERKGGDLMIIYLDNDTTSEALQGRDLYNPKLDRPRRHPLLAPLTKKRRFLSVHRGLTEFQKDHIARWVDGQNP